MTPRTVSKRVVADRLAIIEELLRDIRELPLESQEKFLSQKCFVWAAESCIRRNLEALFDIGRHILAKGFGRGVSEYKEIAKKLKECGVLTEEETALMVVLAGYRNRMVHYYHEVSPQELYEICTNQLGDIETLKDAFIRWVNAHPNTVD